jgi:hypothetical protein
MSELPSFRELLGDADTLCLIEKFGGTRISVPTTVKDVHPLRTEVGERIFKKLVRHYGGSHLLVPLARHWRIEVYRYQHKKTHREIARLVGCGESMVYRVLRKQEVERRQLTLQV